MATFSYCRKQSTHFLKLLLPFLPFISFSFFFSSSFFPLLISLDASKMDNPVLFSQCTIYVISGSFLSSFLLSSSSKGLLAILFTNLENDLLTCRLFCLKKGLLVQVPLFFPPPLFLLWTLKCVWLQTAIHYKDFYSLNFKAIQKVPGKLHRG